LLCQDRGGPFGFAREFRPVLDVVQFGVHDSNAEFRVRIAEWFEQRSNQGTKFLRERLRCFVT
jgi:hypothetical protein